jgi:hypothetical protein
MEKKIMMNKMEQEEHDETMARSGSVSAVARANWANGRTPSIACEGVYKS